MIPINKTDNITQFKLEYNFTSREIAVLAKFFRNNQDKIPEGLDKFSKAVECAIYDQLTLEEASRFYS